MATGLRAAAAVLLTDAAVVDAPVFALEVVTIDPELVLLLAVEEREPEV